MSAEAARGGHLFPFELLEQLILRHRQLLLQRRLAVRVVGSAVVGVVAPVRLGQAAVVGEARSQPDAVPIQAAAAAAGSERSVLAVDVVVFAGLSSMVLGEGDVDGLPGKVVASQTSRRVRVPSL